MNSLVPGDLFDAISMSYMVLIVGVYNNQVSFVILHNNDPSSCAISFMTKSSMMTWIKNLAKKLNE